MITYMLISTTVSSERDVYCAISKMIEVAEVHILFGEWDIIVQIESENRKEMCQLVTRISSIKGVVDIKSLTGFRGD